MISSTLKITLLLALLCYFVLLLIFLKRKTISLKYTLIWILAGIVMGMLVTFPELLIRVKRILGIESNMNGLFIMAIGFLMAILMSITAIVSRQSDKIKILVEALAIQEKRIRDLESERDNVEGKSSSTVETGSAEADEGVKVEGKSPSTVKFRSAEADEGVKVD